MEAPFDICFCPLLFSVRAHALTAEGLRYKCLASPAEKKRWLEKSSVSDLKELLVVRLAATSKTVLKNMDQWLQSV